MTKFVIVEGSGSNTLTPPEDILEMRLEIDPASGSLYLRARNPGEDEYFILSITPNGELFKHGGIYLRGIKLDNNRKIKEVFE